MKFVGHNHGLPTNRYSCGSDDHRGCSGFSGGNDTFICGCCCHDGYYPRGELTDVQRTWIARVLDSPSQPAPTDTEEQP